MKKRFKLPLLSGLFLLTFVIVWVISNLVPVQQPAGVYTLNDLPPADPTPDNGYYTLMALTYPPDADVASSDVIEEIGRISDRRLLESDWKVIREKARKHNDLSKGLDVKEGEAISGALIENLDSVGANRDKIVLFAEANPALVKRYSRLLQAERIEDFSLPSISYPLPNLTALMKAANHHTASQILAVLDGRWEEGVSGILGQIAFCRKLSSGSRQAANKVVSLKILRDSAKALGFVMNQKNCPDAVFAQVLNGLPPLEDSEIGMRNVIIFEFLMAVQGIDEILRSRETPFESIGVLQAGFLPSTADWLNFLARFRIFLNRNRTVGHFLSETNMILEFEKTPPYQWKQNLADLEPPEPTKGLFWWFVNPIGKALMAVSYESHQRQIFEKYRTQAVFDLVRTCGEFHQKTTGQESPAELCENLGESIPIDPFSGRPYVCDATRQTVYSPGHAGTKGGGPEHGEPSGLEIPCHSSGGW